jgi:pyruvate dehydrogenase E1 component
MAAAVLLSEDWGVDADLWSVTSFNELTREAQDCERWNMLHPEATPRKPYVAQVLEGQQGPFVAATDYMKVYADQIRAWVPGTYRVLGTDGYGRSDTRAQLRKHFEVNRYYIAVAALKSLADEGTIPASDVAKALKKYGIDSDKTNPLYA